MTAQLQHDCDVVVIARNAYDDGYSKGWVARGEERATGDCYVSVPLPWRLIEVGDTVISPAKVVDGVVVVLKRKWTIERIEPVGHNRLAVAARCGTAKLRAGLDPQDKNATGPLDRNATVFVLAEAGEAESLAVLREQGAATQILARTTETRST